METTTRQMLRTLETTLVERYSAELAKLPMKKHVRECLIDGYRVGVMAGVYHVCQMLEITVTE